MSPCDNFIKHATPHKNAAGIGNPTPDQINDRSPPIVHPLARITLPPVPTVDKTGEEG